MKVIIDCDPGNGVPGANVDDTLALTYALRCPDLDVRAIWTVFGNTSAPEGARAARALLDAIDRTDVPVRQGSDSPLTADVHPEHRKLWRSKLDGPSQDPAVFPLWGSPSAPTRIDEGDAVPHLDQLEQDLLEAGQGVVLICIGPLTNLARLLASHSPAVDAIGAVYVMGGAIADPALVDTNFAVDPLAAKAVIESGIPLTVVPLDVTRTTELTPAAWHEIVSAAGNGDTGAATLDSWVAPWLAYSQDTRPVNGMWLHDLVAVLALIHPESVTVETAKVRVSGSPAGKLLLDDRGRPVTLVTSVDNSALVTQLATAVAGQPVG